MAHKISDIFSFLKRDKNSPSTNIGREGNSMNTDFIKGISFEENPFENETPDETIMYDVNGNEVR